MAAVFFLCAFWISGGCVHRTMTITTDSGVSSEVFIDGKYRGKTPYSENFVYYGTHEVMLRDPNGVVTVQDISLPRPWFEYFPLDFISECVIPAVITSRYEFVIKPPKQRDIDFKAVKERAAEYRNEFNKLCRSDAD